MNGNLLKSKMVLYGDTQDDLANALDISRQNLNIKLNATNGAEFSQSEIAKIKTRYSLTAQEVDEMFFS